MFRINSIGDVFPCSICDVDELMLGNIKKQTLKEISESEKLSSFIKKCQSRYSSFGECSKCVIKSFCKRGCPMGAYLISKDFSGSDGYCSLRKALFLRQTLYGR